MTPPRKLTASLAALGLVLALAAGQWLALRTWPAATDCTFARPQPPGAVTFAPIARATQVPFATAQPFAVQPGQPSVMIARRDGLTLQVRLPKDAYLNGEAGQAQGHEPPPWLRALGIKSVPPYLAPLAPGQSVTDTLVFHVAGPAPTYAFWVETHLSLASPTDPQVPDNIWRRLEAGPLPLRVVAPAPSQRLQAQLQADRLTWSLRVTDLAGQVAAGPLVGQLEAASAHGSYSYRPLDSRPDGQWSMGWGDQDFGSGPFMVRASVSAPGYVSAVVTVTVDGSPDAATHFYSGQAPAQWTYATLEAAQAALGIPLYRLGVRQNVVSAGAAPDSIQAEVNASSAACYITTHQLYQRPAGAWLELAQFYANPAYANAGWGDAYYDAEAQTLSIGRQPAYLIQRLGWWVLDWKIGDDGFEMRAPVVTNSASDLLALASSVRR